MKMRWNGIGAALLFGLSAIAAHAQATANPDDSVMVDEEIEMTDSAAMEMEEAEVPEIEKMPELIRFEEADYPPELINKGIQGTVSLILLVSDSGTVDSAGIERGIHPVLDTNALTAARRFRFSPAIAGGEPVPVLLQYDYRFSLQAVVDSVQQHVNFSGKLIERGTRRPVVDAMVVVSFVDTLADTTLPAPFSVYRDKIGTFEGQHVEEGHMVTMSDSTGLFRFYSLPAGPVALSFPLAGYEPFTDTVTIQHAEEVEVKYYLRALSYSDYEIVVYGKTEEKEVSRRQLTIQEVKKIPGLGGDAVKVVQAMPGVSRPSFGSGEIVVRGAPTWDSRFFLNGVTIPALYHFGGLKSTYNSTALEAVDFYPGGYGTRYGGATGGIIEIKGRKAKTDRWHGTFDMSVLDGSFVVEGPLSENVSVLASARRSFVGDVLGWYIENAPTEFPFTLSPFYWDYILRTDIVLNENHSMFVTLFGSRDSMSLFFPSMQGGSEEVDKATQNFDMSNTFHLGLIGLDSKINDKLSNSARYSISASDQNFSIFGYVKTDMDNVAHHILDELTYTHSDRLSVSGGVDANFTVLDLMLNIPGGNNMIRRDTVDNWLFGVVGAYSFLEWKPLTNLTLIPSIRYDYFPELDYDGAYVPEYWAYESFENTTSLEGEPSARLSARYQPIEKHTVKGAVGNYSQTPQPVGQVIMEGWGDPALPATKGMHTVLGHEWQITDLISTDVQLYYNRQWNIPRFARKEDLAGEGNATKLWLSDGKSRMGGLEVMLRHDRGTNFFGWLSYTLSRSERYNPIEDTYEIYDQDETHHLQMVGSWRLPRQWETGFRFRYVTGKPTTPVVGAIDDETYNTYVPVYGPKNSERVGPFLQLDLRLDKKFVYKNWMLSMYLDFQNVSWLLYKSPEMEMYNDFYTDKTTVSNTIIPALGMTAEF